MATFTMTGLGSGFDIDKIVKAYIDAEQVPKETVLDNKKVKLESELSAFGTLKSHVDQLDSALYDLNKLELYNQKAASVDDDSVEITVRPEAQSATYRMSVSAIAMETKLATPAKIEIVEGVMTQVALTTTLKAEGKIKIKVGDFEKDMFIQPDMTLNDIAKIIHDFNSPEPFVETRVIATGRGTRLIFSSEKTGLDFKADITVLEDKDPTGTQVLTQLFGTSDDDSVDEPQKMNRLQVAQDAAIVLDGVMITSASNTFEELVEGVDITVSEADETKSSEFTISKDIGLLTSPIMSFVNAYNNVVDMIDESTYFNAQTLESGPLLGDYLVRNLEGHMQIRSSLSSTMNLSSLGVHYDLEGRLSLDVQELQAAILESDGEIQDFFIDEEKGWVINLREKTRSFLQYNGSIDLRIQSINESIDKIEDAREVLLDRMKKRRELLYNNFNAMDALVGQLNALSDSIEDMMASLPGAPDKD